MSKVNPDTMKGPGDFNPPEDDEAYTECEECNTEFSYDPESHKNADEDGWYYYVPRLCKDCQWLEDNPVDWDNWLKIITENSGIREDVTDWIVDLDADKAPEVNAGGPKVQLDFLKANVKPQELIEELESQKQYHEE